MLLPPLCFECDHLFVFIFCFTVSFSPLSALVCRVFLHMSLGGIVFRSSLSRDDGSFVISIGKLKNILDDRYEELL